MKNEDIEILDDFQDNQMPNSNNIPDMNRPLEPQKNVESVTSSFDQMISESSYNNQSVNNFNQNAYQSMNNFNQNNQGMNQNNFNQSFQQNDQGMNQNNFDSNNGYPNDYNNNFNTDVNNNMVQPNQEQDLTITAVYPNGLALEENEELENTRVIKTKKKSSIDLYLVIIVAVLAITLVVLLVVFYF